MHCFTSFLVLFRRWTYNVFICIVFVSWVLLTEWFVNWDVSKSRRVINTRHGLGRFTVLFYLTDICVHLSEGVYQRINVVAGMLVCRLLGEFMNFLCWSFYVDHIYPVGSHCTSSSLLGSRGSVLHLVGSIFRMSVFVTCVWKRNRGTKVERTAAESSFRSMWDGEIGRWDWRQCLAK